MVPFSIDWNEYVTLNNAPAKAQNELGKSCFIQDVDTFLVNIPTCICKAEWSVNGMNDSTMKAMSMKHILPTDNIKMGEDIGVASVPVFTNEDVPNTLDAILSDRANAIIPNRAYIGRFTKKPAFRRQRGKKLPRNGRKQQNGSYLIKDYTKMPYDRANFHPASNTCQPNIFLDTHAAHQQFPLDFPEECREHGFTVSVKGQTLYWNAHLKDFATQLLSESSYLS